MRLLTVDDGGGRWLDTTPAALGTHIAGAAWFWLDVAAAEPAEVGAVAEALDLAHDGVADVLEPTEFPKATEYGESVFVVSHSPGLSEERFTTHELDAFLSPRSLVTFHREEVPGIEWTMARDMSTSEGPSAVLAAVLDAGAGRFLRLIDGLGRQIAELEAMAIDGHPEVPGRVQALRRDAIVLRTVLAPERDMVRSLTRSQLEIEPVVLRHMESVYDDYYRIVESLDTARALLGSVLDTYRSTVAERTNEVMKVLTVFSVIFLPLSLLAGIYGMNFANMPELGWRWGYYALMGIMGALALGLWLYFGRRGFIGGPRIPRVDRTIGRGLGGLVHLTTAPVRGVLRLWPGDDSD